MALWTAFSIGLLGSLHCVGMCGPIALSLPYQGQRKYHWHAVWNVTLYNIGRVISYSLLGLVIGLFGKGFFLAGLQSWLSIAIGIFLLVVALFSINVEQQLLRLNWMFRLNHWVKIQLGHLLRQPGHFNLLGIGLLNGLLPCGLVYVAIVGALSTGNFIDSSLYMIGFGLGTIPLMLSAALGAQLIGLGWRRRLRRVMPFFLVAFAVLFLLRGMQFDVPVDFRFWQNSQEVPLCH
ncbi:MAG TPA: sulfite exporter TauE/SafE family protein [Saprospiraceae bacterium]|nr:sulfite exporter TauE/SafE family protein [Saprospiraceae bacterium]